MKLNCQHADTCLPDYWRGHHLPHVSIPVHRRMRISEVRQALRSEITQGAVMGSNNEARLLSAVMVRPEEEKLADALTKAAYAAINRDVKMKKPGVSLPFWDTLNYGPEDEIDFNVYAYFVFKKCE